MKTKWCFVLALVVQLGSTSLFAQTIVRMRSPQSSADASHAYFMGLVRIAMDKTVASDGPWRLQLVGSDLTQARALAELETGRTIDLDWAGTSIEREKVLMPIRIPLTGGLLGYRVPVIRRADIPRFAKVRSLDELKQFTAIQGSHWPDSDILEASGLKVLRTVAFANMYPMLAAGRGDYFPRGLNEVYAEVESLQNPDLVAYDQLIIAYRFPMYFFTAKSRPELASRVERGLRAAIKDGSFLRWMKSSPVTRHVFPLERYASARIIELPNPFLPPQTPLGDSSLWLTAGKASLAPVMP